MYGGAGLEEGEVEEVAVEGGEDGWFEELDVGEEAGYGCCLACRIHYISLQRLKKNA